MSSEKILRGVATGGHGGAPIFRSNNPILTKRRAIYAHNFNTRPSPRALPNITSGSEVWQIFKIRTVQTPDVFLHGRQTFDTFKIDFFVVVYNFLFKNLLLLLLLTPNLCPGTLCE